MSTDIHYVCVDHDPPLWSQEIGCNLHRDLPRVRNFLAHRITPTSTWTDVDASGYWLTNAKGFLNSHPHCRIEIRDEYGDVHPIEAQEGSPE